MDVEEAVILCVPNMVQDFLHISTVALREVDACFFFFFLVGVEGLKGCMY
jgi:hypothetical protein